MQEVLEKLQEAFPKILWLEDDNKLVSQDGGIEVIRHTDNTYWCQIEAFDGSAWCDTNKDPVQGLKNVIEHVVENHERAIKSLKLAHNLIL